MGRRCPPACPFMPAAAGKGEQRGASAIKERVRSLAPALLPSTTAGRAAFCADPPQPAPAAQQAGGPGARNAPPKPPLPPKGAPMPGMPPIGTPPMPAGQVGGRAVRAWHTQSMDWLVAFTGGLHNALCSWVAPSSKCSWAAPSALALRSALAAGRRAHHVYPPVAPRPLTAHAAKRHAAAAAEKVKAVAAAKAAAAEAAAAAAKAAEQLRAGGNWVGGTRLVARQGSGSCSAIGCAQCKLHMKAARERCQHAPTCALLLLLPSPAPCHSGPHTHQQQAHLCKQVVGVSGVEPAKAAHACGSSQRERIR